MIRPQPRSTLFPYTTLFRSLLRQGGERRTVPENGYDRDHGACGRRRQLRRVVRKERRKRRFRARNRRFRRDRKSTRLNSSHANISYAVFCLKKKKNKKRNKKRNESWISPRNRGTGSCVAHPTKTSLVSPIRTSSESVVGQYANI